MAKPAKLKTFDGQEFDTGKLEGKTMFVFVNAMCSMCSKEMRDLEKYADKFDKVKVYIVSVDMELERVKGKYESVTKLFPGLHDPDFAFGQSVGFYSTPGTILLDKDGKILNKKNGYRPEYLKEILDSL